MKKSTMTSRKKVNTIVDGLAKKFPSFGGGNVNSLNPISIALKDRSPMFATGVDIKKVVRFVLLEARK